MLVGTVWAGGKDELPSLVLDGPVPVASESSEMIPIAQF